MADLKEQIEEHVPGTDGGADSVFGALKSKELLVPAALSAASAVVAAKAPDVIQRLSDATERKGEETAAGLGEKAAEGAKQSLASGKGMFGKAIDKALPGGGNADGGGGKKTRRLPIERWTDVAVPVAKAYDAWNKFDQYPKFMHRVLSVRQKDTNKISWQEKIWFSKRQWEGEITDRRKNDRIAWKTTSGMAHRGVVSFHELGPHLTRVMITMEFEPTGLLEKMASGMRFAKRAVESDLARFKAYVELDDAQGIEYRPDNASGERDVSRRERAEARKDRRAANAA